VKRVLLVLATLVLVASGVAMVSAYEAHTINVTAHVENAMTVDIKTMHFGTVFPEEWLTREFTIHTSDSFCYELRKGDDQIEYDIYVVRKPIPQDPRPVPYPTHYETILGEDYYYWLGDAMYIGINPTDEWPNDPDASPHPGDLDLVGDPSSTVPVASENLSKIFPPGIELGDRVVVGLDVPVFIDYYNEATDLLATGGVKPSGLPEPTVILEGDRHVPEGIILGADIIVQITDIWDYDGK